MVRTALLIEHDTDVLEGAYDQIISLGDGCEVVSCQEEARERFFDERDKFDYIVCELNLPARRNSPAPSCENAARFMREVKSFSPTPFFILADVMLIAKGYAAKMMKEGADNVVDTPFPSQGWSLGRSVEKFYTKMLPFSADGFFAANHPLQELTGGIITLNDNGVVINDIFMCDYQEISGAGKIFIVLSEQSKYADRIHRSAAIIAKALGISEETFFVVIKRLRDRLSKQFYRKNILCGAMQVIPNIPNVGYSISKDFEIRDNRTSASHEPALPTNKTLFKFNDIIDPKELWILEQLCRGMKLMRLDVEKQFSLSAKMAGRFLTRLHRRGIIEFYGCGSQGYWKMVDAQRAKQCAIFQR